MALNLHQVLFDAMKARRQRLEFYRSIKLDWSSVSIFESTSLGSGIIRPAMERFQVMVYLRYGISGLVRRVDVDLGPAYPTLRSNLIRKRAASGGSWASEELLFALVADMASEPHGRVGYVEGCWQKVWRGCGGWSRRHRVMRRRWAGPPVGACPLQ